MAVLAGTGLRSKPHVLPPGAQPLLRRRLKPLHAAPEQVIGLAAVPRDDQEPFAALWDDSGLAAADDREGVGGAIAEPVEGYASPSLSAGFGW